MMHSKVIAIKDRQLRASESSRLPIQKSFPASDQFLLNDNEAAPTIAMPSVHAFLTGAHAAGLDIDKLLRESGVPEDFFHNPSGRVSVKQWARILQSTILTMNDESCGLFQRALPHGTFLMICRAFIHCKTVGQAMERYVEFYNLLLTGITYKLERDKRSVHFKVVVDNLTDVKNTVILDFVLVGFHRLFSWLISEMIQIDSTSIATPPPAHYREYEEAFFHTPVQYGQSFHGISFSSTYLDLPIVRTELDLEKYIARFNTSLFRPISKTGKLSFNLRAYLLAEIERTGQMPELHETAEHFGIHSRALCRRLKEEGLSFQEIKSRVRRDIAIYHLSKTSISMEKIADYAGFSETSAFIRAFRSWTNMTPLAYRKAVAVDVAPKFRESA